MSLKEYLKRYESGQKKPKKVTKKVRKEVISRVKIIEEDFVLKPTWAKKPDSEEEFSDDDKPVLTFQNNRTDELRMLGKFSLSRWTEAPSVSETSSEMNSAQSERRKRRHDSPVSDDGGKEEEEVSFEHISSTRTSILSCSSSAERTATTLPSEGDDGRDIGERLPDGSVQQGSKGSNRDVVITRKNTVSELENDVKSGRDTVSAKEPPRIAKSHEPADLSPPRRQTARRRHDSEESDLSPPRKAYAAVPPPRSKSPSSARSSRKRDSDESDLSPPRKGRIDPRAYAAVPPPSSRSPSIGRSESRSSRDRHSRTARDKSVESNYSSSRSGRDAKPVVRKKMTVKKETEEEKALREELEKRFAIWSKGVKQVKEREAKLEEMAKEIEKPLARYAGDEDLEAHLKSQLYEDDPMYEYMMRKRRRENPGPPQCSKGRLALPNRFSIPPGARWDGVDRSNGFETRLLSQKNLRQAEKEEYYKWAAGTYE
ncbi:hypothetical protein D918_00295 [Trichuris suis]|nr:hypothetical protein D918_00295 [Trichuris suis]